MHKDTKGYLRTARWTCEASSINLLMRFVIT